MRRLDASAGSFGQVIVTCLLLCGLLLAYFPAAVEAKAIWSNSITYSHGLLVVFIAVWLICKASIQQRMTMSPPAWLSAMTAVFGLLWFISYFSSTQFAQLVSFVGLIYLALLALFGLRSALSFVVPVGILLFAVPIWDVFTPLLKELTIIVNSFWLNLAQRTAFIEGDIVHVRAGKFAIEGGCSGLHFFIVAFCLGVVYAYSYLRTILGGVIFVVTVIAMAMIDNWLRVFIIIMAGDLTGMQHYLVTVDHYTFGWVVFALSLIPMVLIGRLLERREEKSRFLQSANVLKNAFLERLASINGIAKNRKSQVSIFVVSLLFFPVYALSLTLRDLPETAGPLDFSIRSGEWQPGKLDDDLAIKMPQFAGPENEYFQVFDSGSRYIFVYLNRYPRQMQGAELIGYENVLFPGTRSTMKLGFFNINMRRGMQFGVFHLFEGSAKRIALVGYNVGGRIFANPASTKFWTGIYALSGLMTTGAIIVQTHCAEDCGAAQRELEAFIEANVEELVVGIQGRKALAEGK